MYDADGYDMLHWIGVAHIISEGLAKIDMYLMFVKVFLKEEHLHRGDRELICLQEGRALAINEVTWGRSERSEDMRSESRRERKQGK